MAVAGHENILFPHIMIFLKVLRIDICAWRTRHRYRFSTRSIQFYCVEMKAVVMKDAIAI